MSDLDVLLGDDGEPAPHTRGRTVLGTFVLAVVTAAVVVVLLALLLYGLGVGGAALWAAWWEDFA